MGKVIVTRTKRSKEENTCCSSFCFIVLSIALQVTLIGSLALSIFWIIKYRNSFGWHNEPDKEFNLHPVLMIGGFVFLMGESMLVYRICRCCRRIYNKLWHTVLHLLAMPAIAIAVVAAFDYHHRVRPYGPIPDLYSFHSWMGVITLGLFALQFAVGFFSFLVLLCCDSKTANYRAALKPIHIHFGLATFLMAIATCLTGLMNKLSMQVDGRNTNRGSITKPEDYRNLPDEAYVINALAMTLVAAGLLMAVVIRYPRLKDRSDDVSEHL